jgi:hypothetical protein
MELKMSRRSDLFQQLFGLRNNPFRHGPVTVPGLDTPFYPDLYPGIAKEMAEAFLGSGKPPPFAVFWSLGTGEDARGFGKTRYLLWFANDINFDHGRRALARAGARRPEEKLIALYATFQTITGASLSNLLFDVVHSAVAGSQAPIVPLLGSMVASRWSIHTAGTKLVADSHQSWCPSLFYRLCHATPDQLALFLEDSRVFRDWHKARWGRELFRTLVVFLRMLGVDRVVVLVDQLEDFANWTTPAAKLRRDFARLAKLCNEDPILRGHVTFVLTMHPDSARISSRYWSAAELGAFPSSRPNRHAVVLREPPVAGLIGMVKAYLDHERSAHGGDDRLRPFTSGAVQAVHALCRGRPGHCIATLATLLEIAADFHAVRIDETAVSSWLGDEY